MRRISEGSEQSSIIKNIHSMENSNPNNGFIFDVPMNKLLYKSHFENFTQYYKAYKKKTSRIRSPQNKAVHTAAIKEIARIEQNMDEIVLLYREGLINYAKDIKPFSDRKHTDISHCMCLSFYEYEVKIIDAMCYTLTHRQVQFGHNHPYPFIEDEISYSPLEIDFLPTLGFFYKFLYPLCDTDAKIDDFYGRIKPIFDALTNLCLYKATDDAVFLELLQANIPMEKPFLFYQGLNNHTSTTFYVLE